jgi:hypothetical protein
MNKNIYQFLDVQRIDPPKRSVEERRIEFKEVYDPMPGMQLKGQAAEKSSKKGCNNKEEYVLSSRTR